MLAYLSIEEASSRLIRSGTFSQETIPSTESLTEILTDIEARIDNWLGYRAAKTEYTERTRSNREGVVLLRNYPVIDVVEVGWFQDYATGGETPITLLNLQTIWRQDRRLYAVPNVAVQVKYHAGYEPLPPVFKTTTFDLLKKVIDGGGSLVTLDEPTRDVASISLPGGISKSFRVSNVTNAAGGGQRVIDQLLAPLERYRRKLVT